MFQYVALALVIRVCDVDCMKYDLKVRFSNIWFNLLQG